MTREAGKKVRVAIIGIGNCASALVQCVEFYKDVKDDDEVSGSRIGFYSSPSLSYYEMDYRARKKSRWDSLL